MDWGQEDVCKHYGKSKPHSIRALILRHAERENSDIQLVFSDADLDMLKKYVWQN